MQTVRSVLLIHQGLMHVKYKTIRGNKKLLTYEAKIYIDDNK